ncbi:MAG: hypothetical protein MR543_10860 [Robinsoniella sp.]|nr:hypothetical protein [Robinsoniella sp.]
MNQMILEFSSTGKRLQNERKSGIIIFLSSDEKISIWGGVMGRSLKNQME